MCQLFIFELLALGEGWDELFIITVTYVPAEKVHIKNKMPDKDRHVHDEDQDQGFRQRIASPSRDLWVQTEGQVFTLLI